MKFCKSIRGRISDDYADRFLNNPRVVLWRYHCWKFLEEFMENFWKTIKIPGRNFEIKIPRGFVRCSLEKFRKKSMEILNQTPKNWLLGEKLGVTSKTPLGTTWKSFEQTSWRIFKAWRSSLINLFRIAGVILG